MQGTEGKPNVKALEAALASARATVATLEAALVVANEAPDRRVLTLETAAEASSLSAHTLRTWCKSGRLRSNRGPRGAYLVTLDDVRDAVRAEPTKPSPRKRSEPAANDLDDWDAEADRELRAMGGAT